MSYKDEIEKQLQGVPRQLCVAFAARSALRALPLLAAKEAEQDAFSYWPDSDRSKHLLAIFTAIRFASAASVVDGLGGGSRADTAYATADVADAAASAYHDADVYAYVDVAAAYAANCAACAVARAVHYAAYADADAADVAAIPTNVDDLRPLVDSAPYLFFNSYYKTEIQSELHAINKNPDTRTYLATPLWSQKPPDDRKNIDQHFQQSLKGIGVGFDVWLDWYQERLEGKEIDLDLLQKQVNIPAEIKGQSVAAVNGYLATLTRVTTQQQALAPLNRVRAIFIGNGAAGKTSLIRALNDKSVIEGEEKMTPGIDISEWPVGDTQITAHFWDFGGQVMVHSTHQFFLRERCLYILVMDARAEINANEQAEYWLEHVKAFGKNAPVMLVGNKADLTQVNLDMHSLTEKYGNIIGFYPLSCTDRQGGFRHRFYTFKDDLINELQKVGLHQVYFNEQQFGVMKTLRKRAQHQAFLEHKEFESLCVDHKISTEGVQNRDWLLDLLDKLGVVIHFPQLVRLDSFILNPRWLTYGIYTLLYSDQAQAGDGVFSEANIIEILGTKKIEDEHGNILDYSNDKCGFIIDAMEEFKLCFRLPSDRQQIIIPDLLPSDQPKHNFDKQQAGTLIFEFDFRGFLPRHVMPTFIVSRYDEINNNTCWQQGVLLHSDQYGCDALVQVDYHNRSLMLWLQGDQVARYFTVLRDELLSILQRMADLQYQEWLWLTDEMRVQDDDKSSLESRLLSEQSAKASFKQLLALEAAGQNQYISEAGVYDLATILQIMPKQLRHNVANKAGDGKALNKPSQSVRLFISYAHEDESYNFDLEKILKGIQRQYDQLDWWHDRKMYLNKWEPQILNELDNADMVLMLISPDFMDSDYCFIKEMNRALSNFNNNNQIIVPIIIRHTQSWHKHEIGQHQALPKDGKSSDEWENKDRFWGDVQRGLERELERLLVNRNGE